MNLSSNKVLYLLCFLSFPVSSSEDVPLLVSEPVLPFKPCPSGRLSVGAKTKQGNVKIVCQVVI